MLHVPQEAIIATRKHPGGDPRMRLEGLWADFVSTLINGNGGCDVETRCLVPYIPAIALPDLEMWRMQPSSIASPTSHG